VLCGLIELVQLGPYRVHSRECPQGRTHTHPYSYRGQKQFQETSHAPAKGWHVPGLKMKRFNCHANYAYMYYCDCLKVMKL